MASTMLYELRAYRVADGRMEDEIARALGTILRPEEGGAGLFARHGIPAPVGFWRVLTGPHLPSVMFLYPWTGAAERSTAFDRFGADAEWLAYRSSTNDGSEIVDRMDDLLLRGPEAGRLRPDALYEFVWGAPPAGLPIALGPLVPLCGSRPGPLHVLRHDAGPSGGPNDAAMETRTLCRLVPIPTRAA